MPRKPTLTPRLGDRDYEIFQHVLRYHLTTREVLHKLFFSDSDENAVTKVTSRLVLHEYLSRYELFRPRTYFVLGPQAVGLLGVSMHRTKEFGPQALVREFGTLAFCCLSSQPRIRLTVRELQDRHPQFLQRHLDSSHYYLDNDGQTTRLGFIRVDGGGPADHVVRKCRQDLERRQPHQPFRELIENDRFLIAIVTAREEKAAAIHDCIKRSTWQTRFRIEVAPDLVQLIARFQSD